MCLCVFVLADEEDFLPQHCESDEGSEEVLEHKQAAQVSYEHTFSMFLVDNSDQLHSKSFKLNSLFLMSVSPYCGHHSNKTNVKQAS